MRVATVLWMAGVLWLATAASGCGQDTGPEIALHPDQDAAPDSVDADVLTEEQPDSSDEELDARPDGQADAEIASVIVGVTPTARSSVDGGGSVAASADALLLALSSGARALVVERDWSELADPSAEPPTEAWRSLERLCSFLREQRRALLLSVKAVDATADRRPSDLHGTAWNQASTRQAMHQLVDKVYAVCGDELAYLSLGVELDRYLDSHLSQSPPFTQFALDATDYARTHPARPANLSVGWTWSSAAWLADNGLSEANALVAASDSVMLTYTPLDADGHAKPPSTVSSDMSTLAARIKTHPIVLQRAAYPSSELIGSSEAAQAQFVEVLFASVGAHRSRFPFVGAGLLHDPSPGDCVAYAEAQGKPGSAELYAVWCSVGLRNRDGLAKQAFASFIEAAAGLEAP